MIPTWLARYLVDANPDGCTRQLRASVCRRCGAHVLRGLDADVMAGAATVDPGPISTVGELVAVMASAATYDITIRSRRAELHHRDRWRMRRRCHPVLADHRCGVDWPADPDAAALTPASTEETDEPPF